MQSVMSHNFGNVPTATIPRSSFDRSFGLKTAFDAGYLIPIYVDEALPGDSFNLRMTAFARLATPIKPIMDNLFLDTFFFAVPVRLIWTNFPKFMGEKANPGDSTAYYVPYMAAPAVTGAVTNSLSDYMGIPVGVPNLQFNSLHHRAYNRIYADWFKDQNLQDNPTLDMGDGPDTYTNYTLLRRCKRPDYFTSCLPWPQKGPDVPLPLGTSAYVKTAASEHDTGAGYGMTLRTQTGGLPPAHKIGTDGTGAFGTENVAAGALENYIRPSNLIADLSTATASTINALRLSFQLQKLYERDARGGTRYIEVVKNHFFVDSPDLRAVRPIYLGGGSSPINVHPVAQTTPAAGGSTPQGNLAAFGTSSVVGHGFTKSFTEHCVIIGLANVRADLTYQQGLDRMFSRRTRWDYYWPALAHIGEQAVLNKEIYCDGSGNDALTFGYQERFAEYRYKPSKITGIMRSNVTAGFTTIDYWHLSQDFAALPTLDASFIVDAPPMSRVIAVSTEPHFLFDAFFNLKCARPMPTYSVPGLIDHF